MAHEPPRRLVDPDLARRGRPRLPLGRRGRLADQRGDHVARPDPERERVAAQLQRRPQGAQRVVLVRARRPEREQQLLAADLGDAAAVAGARRGGELPVALEPRAQGLGVGAGERGAHDHAGHAPAHVGRQRRLLRRRRRGDLVAQDRGLERAQLGRRLDAEPVGERLVGGPVGVERVRLAPGVVEREHLAAAQALVVRVLLHERLELAHQLLVAAAGEVGVDAVGQAREPQRLEPRRLRLGEALAGDVRERGAAPQRERLPQRGRRLVRLAARQLRAAAPQERLEAVGVEAAGRRPQRVAAALGHQHALVQRRPQPRGQHLDGLAPVLRIGAAPQLVDGAVDVHDRAAVHEQQREQRERPAPRHAPASIPRLDRDRPEDPELGAHGWGEPTPGG